MPEARTYVLNLNIGGVGKRGEIVTADPVLWAIYIEAGYMSEVDVDGDRLLELEDLVAGALVAADDLDFLADAAGPYVVPDDDATELDD